MKDRIVKMHFYPHAIGEVWNAIAQAENISAWFIQADFKAEVGYPYTFRHEQTTITGNVLEADPVHNLVYTWVVGGTTAVTTVRWKLEEKNGGTFLTLEHTGISNYPEASAPRMFSSFSSGWDHCIEELEKFLKTMLHAG